MLKAKSIGPPEVGSDRAASVQGGLHKLEVQDHITGPVLVPFWIKQTRSGLEMWA